MREFVVHTLGAGLLVFAALSASNTYQLNSYDITSGGSNDSASATYKLNANTGTVSGDTGSGSTKSNKSGVVQTQQANVPAAPTLSNGSNTYYNKLDFQINMTGDASDYTYAVAVSSDNFATTRYVQLDGTLGSTAVYRTYAAWGEASGSTIVGLAPNTTYQVKVGAVQGKFTASMFGPYASAATSNPALSFSISPNTVNLGSLLAGSVVTAGTAITTSFSTNAAAGGAVYIAGQYGGLYSSAVNYKIDAVSSDLSGAGKGFGVQGGSASQSGGGPFTVAGPFNQSGNTVGAPSTSFVPIFTASAAISGGTASATLKAMSATTTPAAQDYKEVLTFIASASF